MEGRLSDPNLKCQNRADVNIYGSWCVTLPTLVPVYDEDGNMLMEDKEVHHRDGTVTQSMVLKLKEVHYTDEQVQLFFRLTYDFLSERYGKENVISSYVHMDETTPHTHFLFIPVVDDKKWNQESMTRVVETLIEERIIPKMKAEGRWTEDMLDHTDE